MTNDKALEAARQAIRYLSQPETPWSDEQVQAVISAYLSALPGEAEVVMEQIAHKEQIGIWANELTSALSLSDFLREDWSFDDSVDLEKEVAAQLLDIIRSAITHPGLNLVASLQAMQARAEKAEEAANEAKDAFWAIYPKYFEMLGAPVSTETARTHLAARVKELEEAKRHLEAAMLSADPYQHIRAAIRSLGDKT